MSSVTIRRQRSALAFSHNATTFLGHATLPQSNHASSTKCSPQRTHRRLFPETTTESHSPILMVAAPPPNIKSPLAPSRFAQPVPAPKPHEIMQPKRGRNSRRRIIEAEQFRKYIYLRRQLKPWSDDFRAKHGRTPSLIDVHASDIPGLMDRFVEYLEALELLRVDV